MHIAEKNTKSGNSVLMECKWVRKDCFPDKCRRRVFICWGVIPDFWLEFITSFTRYYKPFICGERDRQFEIKSSTYSISVWMSSTHSAVKSRSSGRRQSVWVFCAKPVWKKRVKFSHLLAWIWGCCPALNSSLNHQLSKVCRVLIRQFQWKLFSEVCALSRTVTGTLFGKQTLPLMILIVWTA